MTASIGRSPFFSSFQDQQQSEQLKMSDSLFSEYTRRAEVQRQVEAQEHELCDCVLSVRKWQSEERVDTGSNSAMLMLVSDFFKAMFAGDQFLRGEIIELPAKVTDVGVRAIHNVAFGLFTQVNVRAATVAPVMAAAQHANVAFLMNLSESFLRSAALFKKLEWVAQVLRDLHALGFVARSDELLNHLDSRMLSRLLKKGTRSEDASHSADITTQIEKGELFGRGMDMVCGMGQSCGSS